MFNLWPTIYKQYWIVLRNQLHFLRMFQSQFQLSLIKEAWGMTMQISKTFATNFPVRYVLQYVN